MNTIKLLLAITFSLFLTVSANANDYVSIGLQTTNYNVPFPENLLFDSTTSGYEIAVGRQLPVPWLSFEVALSDNGETNKNVGPLDFSLSSKSAAFLLHGAWQVATAGPTTFKAHARLGYSITKFTAEEGATGLSNNATDIGLTYSTGVSVWFTPNWALEINYMRRDHKATIIPLNNIDLDMEHYVIKGVYQF